MKKRFLSFILVVFTLFSTQTTITVNAAEVEYYYCSKCSYKDTNAKKVSDHIIGEHPFDVVLTENKAECKEKLFKQYTMYVNKKCSVYSGTGKKKKVVATYTKGKKVTVINKKGDWRKVGKGKWIYYKNLSKKNPNKYYNGVKLQYSKRYNITSKKLTRSKGVNYYNGSRETWYSQKVLPGRGLNIPGRHVADDGTIRDKNGYLVVACNGGYKKKGTKIMTSLGPAVVRDCGCAYGTVDIYVNW